MTCARPSVTRLAGAAALLVALSLPGMAQKAPATVDPARMAAAKELMEAQGGVAQAKKSLEQMTTAMVEQVRRSSPGEAEGLKQFMQTNYAPDNPKVSSYFKDVLEVSAQFYAERCTVEELKAMAVFMKTPVGQKFVLLAPDLAAAMAPTLIKFQQGVIADVQAAAQRGDFKK